MNSFQVAVIGAGVVGSLVARELTKYDLSVALIEAREDVATGASAANSAIVHGGFDPEPGTLKARLNVRGTELMPALAKELGVPYRNNGSLVLAFSEQEMETVRKLYERGLANGVPRLSLLGKEELRELEPNVSDQAIGALRVASAGIVCPYGLAIAAAGNAADNGAELFLSSPVESIRREGKGFVIQAGNNRIGAEYIVNCAGIYADHVTNMIGDESFTLRPRKGEYLLFDPSEGQLVNHTLFQVPTDAGKGVLVTPTVHGNLLIGPTSVFTEDRNGKETTADGLASVREAAGKSVKALNFRQVITSFAGLRAVPDSEGQDFIIRFSDANGHFLHCAGIESPGLSASPAIAEYAVELLNGAGLELKSNANFRGERRSYHWFKELSPAEKNEVIRKDSRYGKVVCRCETVTEGEIVEAIHRAPRATTLDALKRRLRSGMGRCQGGFCTPLLVEILARETGKAPTEICKSAAGSVLLMEEMKK